MKIFFFSTVFAPSVGGIQKLAETLCNEFVALGHEVRLATLTPGAPEESRSYEVVRKPTLRQFLDLLGWCDVHIQANVSLKYAFARLLRPRHFVYSHQNVYQDDDGTVDLRDRLKRVVAGYTPGIACSRYTASKLHCAHTIFNTYDDAVFTTRTPWEERRRDLVFVGRLVSQKGCDGLLRALGRLRSRGLTPDLTVIGDGPERMMLEALASSEGVAEQIRFAGTLQGRDLAAELNRHRIMIVPSCYEEPFGIVALEGLACGCLPIVSVRGGLVDAIGPHGFTFPNGDDAALADTMEAVLGDIAAARVCLSGVESHLDSCSARRIAKRYIEVFEGLVDR